MNNTICVDSNVISLYLIWLTSSNLKKPAKDNKHIMYNLIFCKQFFGCVMLSNLFNNSIVNTSFFFLLPDKALLSEAEISLTQVSLAGSHSPEMLCAHDRLNNAESMAEGDVTLCDTLINYSPT